MAVRLPTDEQIQQTILAELKWAPRAQAAEIGVAAKGRRGAPYRLGGLLHQARGRQ
jgi:hypothetical protein